MQNPQVRPYYDALETKSLSLAAKRIFDFILGILMFVVLLPLQIVLSVSIKSDSKGPVFFLQERVTRYGKIFKMIKFRTMTNGTGTGSQITVKNDPRITRVGRVIRKYRLDEIPQLINVICGDMSFVGTRPEVVKYVNQYTDEMFATLLMPAGITSEASIYFKDEDRLLEGAVNIEERYITQVLPQKMKYNLSSISRFSFFGDIVIMFKTVLAVLHKNEKVTAQKENSKSSVLK